MILRVSNSKIRRIFYILNIEFFEKTNIKTDGIDLDKSYISFDSSTLNLIIELYLKKILILNVSIVLQII